MNDYGDKQRIFDLLDKIRAKVEAATCVRNASVTIEIDSVSDSDGDQLYRRAFKPSDIEKITISLEVST